MQFSVNEGAAFIFYPVYWSSCLVLRAPVFESILHSIRALGSRVIIVGVLSAHDTSAG
jgi:hypothetical protein